MLNMKREFRFAPPLDCLAQTWEAESGCKRSAKSDFVDKAQCRRFAGYAARRNPSEVVVTIGFQSITGYQRRSGHARSRYPFDAIAHGGLREAARGDDFVTARVRKQSAETMSRKDAPLCDKMLGSSTARSLNTHSGARPGGKRANGPFTEVLLRLA